MQIIILCPQGIRTGGPEAAFQLSDALIRKGVDARMWLITNEDLASLRDLMGKGGRLANINLEFPERINPVQEYDRYQWRPVDKIAAGEDAVFVLPEIYIWMAPLLLGMRWVLWWLSVDNAFRALSETNLNLIRLPNIVHAAQSAYAQAFAGALGLPSIPLSDYTIVPARQVNAVDLRPMRVSINAGNKVIFNMNELSGLLQAYCPGLEIVKIAGLSRDQVYEAFATSRVFVDLGNLPGKDRMAREALLLGCHIVVGAAGAGAHETDFPINALYRPVPHQLDEVARLVTHMVTKPLDHHRHFAPARAAFQGEREAFDREVAGLLQVLARTERGPR